MRYGSRMRTKIVLFLGAIALLLAGQGTAQATGEDGPSPETVKIANQLLPTPAPKIVEKPTPMVVEFWSCRIMHERIGPDNGVDRFMHIQSCLQVERAYVGGPPRAIRTYGDIACTRNNVGWPCSWKRIDFLMFENDGGEPYAIDDVYQDVVSQAGFRNIIGPWNEPNCVGNDYYFNESHIWDMGLNGYRERQPVTGFNPLQWTSLYFGC